MFTAFLFFKFSFNHKEIGPMLNILRCQRIEIAFSVSQMIHRIQYIGFTHSIFPYKTIDFSVKSIGYFSDIFIVK